MRVVLFGLVVNWSRTPADRCWALLVAGNRRCGRYVLKAERFAIGRSRRAVCEMFDILEVYEADFEPSYAALGNMFLI